MNRIKDPELSTVIKKGISTTLFAAALDPGSESVIPAKAGIQERISHSPLDPGSQSGMTADPGSESGMTAKPESRESLLIRH